MSINHLRGTIEWALMVALVFGAGAIAQAQDEEAKPEGPVIQIGKSDATDADPKLPPPDGGGFNLRAEPGPADRPQTMKYWIGLAAAPLVADHPLRSYLDVPDNLGLLVASVVPDSPADKAGLKRHDILLRANDSDLREMQDIVELVVTEGDKKGRIAIEVLRKDGRETVYITPEARPAAPPRPQGEGGGFGQGFGEGFGEGFGGGFGEMLEGELPQQLMREFRNFGPGVVVGGGGAGVANMPNGVSVSINKQDGQPARITVKRGDETWEVVGDDPESLEQLPEDLRPFVEQMLNGGARRFNFRMRDGEQAPMPEFGEGRLQERLERMERRLEEMQKRLRSDEQPADEPVQEGEQG